MPEISVIIPTFNRAKILPKAIDSVLQQTYKDYEIVVIDDGSTDDTKEVLMRYGDKIIYRFQENKGISSARNRGIEIARGRYIALLDSDDYWLPEKLEKQVACFQKNPSYRMVATRCSSFKVDGNFTSSEPKEEIKKKSRSGKSGWIYKELFYKNFIRTSSVLIEQECFKKIGTFDETLYCCNDVDMWIRIAKEYEVGFINDILTVYTDNPKGISNDGLAGRKTYVEVLEKNYDPTLIPLRLYKKRMARMYAHIGKHYVRRGDFRMGKQVLLKSLFLQHFNIRALKNYGLAIWKEKYVGSFNNYN